MNSFNIWLWLALIPAYFLYEFVGTKNQLYTNKLNAVKASNTGVLMYIIGTAGTYLCVKEGLINLIPIVIGSWVGTYYSVKWENCRNIKIKNMFNKITKFFENPLVAKVLDLEKRILELEAINAREKERRMIKYAKTNKGTKKQA